MAVASAKVKNLSIAPRKVRLVADLIRGKKVGVARNMLQVSLKGSALPMRKLLDSAVANAENEAQMNEVRIDADEMVISRIVVNEGRTLRRFNAAARGRAVRIRKRSCHIELHIS